MGFKEKDRRRSSAEVHSYELPCGLPTQLESNFFLLFLSFIIKLSLLTPHFNSASSTFTPFTWLLRNI